MTYHTLLELAAVFAKLSLLSIGSSATIVGQMQRDVVAHGWMTAAEFTQAYGLSQSTPGSGAVIAVPIGYKAAGLAGVLVAFSAFYVPTFLLAIYVTRVWHQIRGSRWPNAVRISVMPVAIGLILAAVYTLGRATVQNLPGLLVIGAVAVVSLRTKLPTVALIGGSMALGAVFLR
ncbi:MAG TPA: chromate transporter [Dehalococcoidia bacterium]|nr:chromate transporter [Dehalococcoidia bacterium]